MSINPRRSEAFGRTPCYWEADPAPLPPPNLRTRVVARRARWQSKALNEYFFENILKKVTSQNNVRSKVKIIILRLVGYQDRTNNTANPNFFIYILYTLYIALLLTQILPKGLSREGMKKVASRYQLYT